MTPESSEGVLELLCALKYMHLFWGHSVHGYTMHQLMKNFKQAGYKCNVSINISL